MIWEMDTRGEHRFSSLMKQKIKAKIYFVICFAGKKKLLFYIYAVIVKQKIINGPVTTTLKHSIEIARTSFERIDFHWFVP